MDVEKKTVVSLTKQMAALVAASAELSYLPHLAPDVTTPDSATTVPYEQFVVWSSAKPQIQTDSFISLYI